MRAQFAPLSIKIPAVIAMINPRKDIKYCSGMGTGLFAISSRAIGLFIAIVKRTLTRLSTLVTMIIQAITVTEVGRLLINLFPVCRNEENQLAFPKARLPCRREAPAEVRFVSFSNFYFLLSTFLQREPLRIQCERGFGPLSSSSEERTKVRSRSALRFVRASNFFPLRRTLGSSAPEVFSISPTHPPARAPRT